MFSLLYFSSTSKKFFKNKIKHHISSTESPLSRRDTKNNNNNHEIYLFISAVTSVLDTVVQPVLHGLVRAMRLLPLKGGPPRLRDMGWPAQVPSFSKTSQQRFQPRSAWSQSPHVLSYGVYFYGRSKFSFFYENRVIQDTFFKLFFICEHLPFSGCLALCCHRHRRLFR